MLQVELQWFFPFVYDDLSNFVRWMDWTIVGLHASWGKGNRWKCLFFCLEMHSHAKHLYLGRSIDVFCDLPADVSDGQFHGVELVFGLVAQQFQFRRAEVKKRGRLTSYWWMCIVQSMWRFHMCDVLYLQRALTYLCVHLGSFKDSS